MDVPRGPRWPRTIPDTVVLAWRAGRAWTLLWLGLLVVQGLLPVATVHVIRLLVNDLAAAAGSGLSLADLRPVLGRVALAGGIGLAGELLRGLGDWVRTVQSQLLQDHVSARIHARSSSVDLAFYESPDFYDRLHRARDEGLSRPQALLEGAGALIQDGLCLLAMAAVLLPYGVWLPLVLAASSAPALALVVRHNRRYHRWWEGTTADRRRAEYYSLLLTHPFAAAEVRLFGLADRFAEAFDCLRRRLRGEQARLIRGQAAGRMAAGACGMAAVGGALVWMVWRTTQGAVSLGDLALFQQAFQRGQGLLRSVLADLGQVYNNALFLRHLQEFLALRPAIVSPAAPSPMPQSLRRGLQFAGVTFTYPGSARPALRGFDLEVPVGCKVAIVGPNGAGKSTLIKLLCRLYDPQAGAVTLDGVDLRAVSVEQLRRQITVLFQHPVRYQATARQNIALGGGDGEAGPERIEAAARAAGAHDLIGALPRGYDTQLGTWFDGGTELSGGQWQRVALARAFLRRSPILLLDEPTSAMDSWSEQEWLDRFDELAAGRTALIVTHRLSAARRADRICVLRDGAVAEAGSHEELLASGGLYAHSWWRQAGADGAPRRAAGGT